MAYCGTSDSSERMYARYWLSDDQLIRFVTVNSSSYTQSVAPLMILFGAPSFVTCTSVS